MTIELSTTTSKLRFICYDEEFEVNGVLLDKEHLILFVTYMEYSIESCDQLEFYRKALLILLEIEDLDDELEWFMSHTKEEMKAAIGAIQAHIFSIIQEN
jgi:hypothetical protein